MREVRSHDEALRYRGLEIPAKPGGSSRRFFITSIFKTLPVLLASFRTNELLRASYRVLAPVYDGLVPHVSSKARRQAWSWLDIEGGERVLDAGTGTGLALLSLSADNPTGWTEGVDLSPAMLDRARRRMADCGHAQYGLRCADVTALPYPDDTFDAAFSGYLLDVLAASQVRPALQEMRRVLRPEGRLVLVYLTAPQRPVERLWAVFARFLPLLAGGARPVALQALLRECGFEVEAQTTCTQAGLRSAVTRAAPSQGPPDETTGPTPHDL